MSRKKHIYITQEEMSNPGCCLLSSPAMSTLHLAFLPLSALLSSQAAFPCANHHLGPRPGSRLDSASRRRSTGAKRGSQCFFPASSSFSCTSQVASCPSICDNGSPGWSFPVVFPLGPGVILDSRSTLSSKVVIALWYHWCPAPQHLFS